MRALKLGLVLALGLGQYSGGGGANTAVANTWSADQTMSAQLIIAAGDKNDPAIVFSADDDGSGTGIYRLGANLFAISSNGTGVFYFASSNTQTVVPLTFASSFGGVSDLYLHRSAANQLTVSGQGTSDLGLLLYGTPIEANTGAKTPAENESGECYTNTGDADGSSITLPDDPTAGTRFCVLTTVAQTITIAPSSGESLYMDADQCLVSMTAASIGANTTIIAAVGGSGGVWIATGHGFVCNDA